jgi:hypothetical protein
MENGQIDTALIEKRSELDSIRTGFEFDSIHSGFAAA